MQAKSSQSRLKFLIRKEMLRKLPSFKTTESGPKLPFKVWARSSLLSRRTELPQLETVLRSPMGLQQFSWPEDLLLKRMV